MVTTKPLSGGGAFNPAWLEWGPASAVFVPAQLDPNSADVGNYFRTSYEYSLTTIRKVGLFDQRQQVVRNPIPVVAVGACGV